MKWDYVIGNPAYQAAVEESSDNKTYSAPVYNYFLDEAFRIADKVEMIHPARFLSNAGSTPKEWNRKMLNDEHLKVVYYEQDSSKIFGNTEIKGGISVTYRDKNKIFGAIKVFSPFEEIRSIKAKVTRDNFKSIKDIIYTQNRFNLENLYDFYPEYKKVIGSEGKDKRFRNNIFDKIDSFTDIPRSETDIAVIGVINNKRCWRYIRAEFIDYEHENLMKWKVIVPRANGKGVLSDVFSTPVVISPNQGYTQTFIGIGAFETENEAINLLRYVKTKFLRTMLSILKVDQHNEKDTWTYVPIQDFTNNSDINWNTTIANIDKQLYNKYDLSQEEIDFIETHVKEME
jgi:hypothetical protein